MSTTANVCLIRDCDPKSSTTPASVRARQRSRLGGRARIKHFARGDMHTCWPLSVSCAIKVRSISPALCRQDVPTPSMLFMLSISAGAVSVGVDADEPVKLFLSVKPLAESQRRGLPTLAPENSAISCRRLLEFGARHYRFPALYALIVMSPPLPHMYGRIKLEEDAFISCHHCDFTSYTFKGFSLHLRKVHGLSLTGKPPRRNKPRPPKTTTSIEGTTSGGGNTVAPGQLPAAGLQPANTMNTSTAASSPSMPEANVETASRRPGDPSMPDTCAAPSASVHVVSQQEEMIKRLVAKREAARVRRAVRRGLRMRPSYGDRAGGIGPGHIEVSFACDRCNFTATSRKDFQTHVMQRTCH